MSGVVTGLQRLARDGASSVLPQGGRIGLLAHQASVDAEGRHAVERLRAMPDVQLRRLFAPEHGLWGHEQDMESVDDATDGPTGLQVVSLYGRGFDSLRPNPAHLGDLDAIVCDLQDVGSRYYTFVYTVSFVMESARDAGIPVVVLDRPNPIDGNHVEGPVLDPALASFVGRYPIPVRHGMTLGELSRFFNESFGIGCDLRVVEMEGWRRSMRFEQTGLPWVAPSPNMPTPTTALVYPGGCLVEGTNLSEGRGTTTPFELVGAPWLDGAALTTALRDAALAGVVFRPASFRPMFQKHAGQPCRGVQVIVTDPEAFRPFAVYWTLLVRARELAHERFAWRTEPYEFEVERAPMDLLLGRTDLREMLERGASHDEASPVWVEDLEAFRELRRPSLLYAD